MMARFYDYGFRMENKPSNNNNNKEKVMKNNNYLFGHLFRRFMGIFTAFILIFMIGCQESVNDPGQTEINSDKEALQKIADEDSSIASFEPNYNEEEAMDVLGLGKVQTEIYPLRVGHKVRLVNRDFNVDIVGDTAYATSTRTYEGVLYISATYTSGETVPDTVIEKPFTSIITRNIIFVRVDSTIFPYRNWKIAAISLPEGGVLSSNIDIKKLTLFLPDGETLVINSPNDYYLTRNNIGWVHGWLRNFPLVPRGDSVLVQVELFSAYADTDFVTLTYGADKMGHHRAKRRFGLVSSVPSGNGYERVYEQTFRTNQWPGFYHAIVNAFPKQVIYDDSTPVENEIWGVPYFVRF
jgi:hypothetical protein